MRTNFRPKVLAAIAAASAALPATAQWTSRTDVNTFVTSTSHRNPTLSGLTAVDHVVVPCNDGCFYAWIDASGVVNVEVINDCGSRQLMYGSGGSPGPFQLPETAHGDPYHRTQIAGASYANGDGAKNQMLLAYTSMSLTRQNQLCAATFEWPGLGGAGTVNCVKRLVFTASTLPPVWLTPTVDSNFTTLGLNPTINGAVIGVRSWSLRTATVDIYMGAVWGPVNAPALRAPLLPVDTFVALEAPRFTAISDHLGNVYGRWRGWDAGNSRWESRGTLWDPFRQAPVALAWTPYLATPTTSTADDWAIASDLQGGAFWADGDGRSILFGHVTAAAVVSNFPLLGPVPPGDSIHTLAMVGIGAPPGTERAALALKPA